MRMFLVLTVTMLLPLLVGAQMPSGTGDVNCSGGDLDISDLVYTVDYMFNGGPEPCEYVSPGIVYKVDPVQEWIPEAPNPGGWEIDLYLLDSISVVIPAPGYLKLDASITVNVTAVRVGWASIESAQPEPKDRVDVAVDGKTTIGCDSFVTIETPGTYTFYLKVRGFGPFWLYRRSLSVTYFPVNYSARK